MKKLTAGIFATILGLTAMGAADAAQVASTKYVQGAIDSLDSSATATEGTALTGVTVVDGKITGKTEVAIPTATGVINTIDMTDAATAGNVVTGVTIKDGQMTVSEAKVQYANVEGTPTLAPVATSGKYSDLTDIPEIPTATGVINTIDMTDAATEGNVVTGVTIKDGVMTVSEAKVQYANVEGTPTLAPVATSGSYDDLTNKPIIPTAEGVLSTYDASAAVVTPGNVVTGVTIADGVMTVSEAKVQYANVEGTPTLATVATSGSYDDLTNKPTLFENSDVNGGTADAGTTKLLQSVKLENGQLTAVATVDIVDTYVAPTPTAE